MLIIEGDKCRQTTLRYEDVPLPKFMESFDDVSEDEEEDVKPQVNHEKAKVNTKNDKTKARKRNEKAKRMRFEDNIERVEKKIEDVANRTDQRLRSMMMDVMTKFEVYEALRDAKMENLMDEIKELKQLTSQSKGTKASMDPSIEIIVLETSSSNASD